MRLMSKLAATLILSLGLACDNNATSPTPTCEELGNCPKEDPPELTFMDRPKLNTNFDWFMGRTFTLFAGARIGSKLPQPVTTDTGEYEDLETLFQTFQAAWPGLKPIARTCGELETWPLDVPWLPRGVSAKPYDKTAPAYKELKNFLEAAIRIPRAQVLVVPICNLKENGTSLANVRKWVKTVCELASQYPNTAIEVVNEAKHPNSSLEPHVSRLIADCRGASVRQMEIGSDANVNARHLQIIKGGGSPYEYSGSDFYSYHMWRNPDPTKEELRAFVRWGLPRVTVFSEQTCFDDQFGLGSKMDSNGNHKGNCTDSTDQIEDLMRGTEKAGGVANFHTTWGLGWPNIPIGWILDFRNWEVRHGR